MQSVTQWIGIEVCKRGLDVHIRPSGQSFRVSNDAVGIAVIVKHLGLFVVIGRIVLEATGGYERQVAVALSQLGYPAGVINARQARNFAKAAHQLAKTDRADAAILAGFGEALQPPLRSLASAVQAELQDLVIRRRQVVDMLTAKQNRVSE